MAKIYDVYVPVEVLFTVKAESKEEAIDLVYNDLTAEEILFKIKNDTFDVGLNPTVEEVDRE